MRAARISERTGIAELQIKEVELPELQPRQVKIRVRAAALNYRDLLVVEGTYPAPTKPGEMTPGSDGAGEIIEVGTEVARAKVGDRVTFACLSRYVDGQFRMAEHLGVAPGIMQDGVLAEYVIVDEDSVVHLPEAMSFVEAATLPCAGGTAWYSMTEHGAPLLPGDSVLVLGSGGVSLFALQIAKMMSCRVIATTSSEAKAHRLKELGADHVLNYKSEPEWGARVKDLTGGVGVQRIVEVAGATIDQSLAAIAPDGHIALVGYLAGFDGAVTAGQVMFSGASLKVATMGGRSHLERFVQAMSTTKKQPVIDSTFKFDEVAHAFARLKSGENFGKVVIEV